MSEFCITISKVQTYASELGNIASRLNGCAGDINEISGKLPFSSPAMQQVKRSLRCDIQVLLEQARSTESFRTGLEEICRTYMNTESGLVGKLNENGLGTSEEVSEEDGWDELNKVLDLISGSECSFLAGILSGLIQELMKIEGFSKKVGSGFFLLGLANDLFQDMQDGATINSLLSVAITDGLVFIGGAAIGDAVSKVITTAFIEVGTVICPGFGTGAGAVIGPIFGEIGGAASSYVFEEIVVNADWDNDGMSNKAEFSEGLEEVLDWIFPWGNDMGIAVPSLG